MNKQYKTKIVEPRSWKCWAWCVMWIMNYFFDTEFSAINSDDITSLVRQKPFEFGVIFTESEMINFLANQWLKIKLYSSNIWYYEKFAKDWIDKWFDKMDILNKDLSQKFTKKIIKHKNVEIIYDNDLIKNTFDIIKKNQSKNKLFVLWWDYFELRQFEKNNNSWWHFFISDWVEWGDFIIQDPWPPVLFNWKIDRKIVEKAMSFIDWKKNPWLLIQVEYKWKVNYV